MRRGDRGIQSFWDLAVWQLATALSVACYRVTSDSQGRMYGIDRAIRAASGSVTANIAEATGG